MSEATPFKNRADILSELWMDYRDDDGFKDFIEYNDLGLPIAYAVANGIVESNKLVEQFIDESFRLLLIGLGIEEDLGFETLTDILSIPKAE